MIMTAKELSIQDAAGMQLAELIRKLAAEVEERGSGIPEITDSDIGKTLLAGEDGAEWGYVEARIGGKPVFIEDVTITENSGVYTVTCEIPTSVLLAECRVGYLILKIAFNSYTIYAPAQPGYMRVSANFLSELGKSGVNPTVDTIKYMSLSIDRVFGNSVTIFSVDNHNEVTVLHCLVDPITGTVTYPEVVGMNIPSNKPLIVELPHGGWSFGHYYISANTIEAISGSITYYILTADGSVSTHITPNNCVIGVESDNAYSIDYSTLYAYASQNQTLTTYYIRGLYYHLVSADSNSVKFLNTDIDTANNKVVYTLVTFNADNTVTTSQYEGSISARV